MCVWVWGEGGGQEVRVTRRYVAAYCGHCTEQSWVRVLRNESEWEGEG